MGDIGVHSYPLECFPNVLNDNHVQVYDSFPEETKMGRFCFPTDPIIKESVMLKSGILDRYRVLQTFKAVALSLGLAVTIGLIYMILVQCLPRTMMLASVVAGGISMVVLGVMIIAFRS